MVDKVFILVLLTVYFFFAFYAVLTNKVLNKFQKVVWTLIFAGAVVWLISLVWRMSNGG